MPRPRANIAGKLPVATGLTSKQLALLDREAKERALFSACTTEQRYVAEMQDVLEDLVAGDIDLAGARKRLKGILDDFGYTPEHGFPDAEAVKSASPGTIEDLSSFGRLNLVLDVNEGMAASVSRLAEETDETLDLFPAWRLVRFMEPNGEPRDWALRWAVAGEEVNWEGACQDDMVARKDSPIWQALGDGAGGFTDTLGNPYPPFAFNSGMGWEDVDRDEAEALGLELDEPVRIEKPSLGISEDEKERAREHYGDTFVNLLMGKYGMSNEGEQCTQDGTFLDENGVCHSKKHDEAAGPILTKPHSDCPYWAIGIANAQARELGYASVEDIIQQANEVTKERIAQILSGVAAKCKAHEGVAAVMSNPIIVTADGREARFNKTVLQHYLYGLNRAGNVPKVGNLCEIGFAIHGLKNDDAPKQAEGGDAGQSIFKWALSRRYDHNTFVYNSGSRINAWHSESRRQLK